MISLWQNRSLRFRLAAWYSLSGVLLLTLFSATVYFYVSMRLGQPLDGQLRLEQEIVREHLSVTAEGKVVWDGLEIRPEDLKKWRQPWFEVWDDQEQLRQRVWPVELTLLEYVPFCPAMGRETLSIFKPTPEIRLRFFSLPLKVMVGGKEQEWMLRVIRFHERTSEAVQSLLLILAVALPTVVLLMVAGGYAVTRRWLLPLDHIASQAEQISADNLSRRLPVANPSDELGRLASAFNSTLARLEDSFTALDRFSADASHELRTPLTTLRSVGEVALQQPRTAEEYREVIASMLEEAQRLQTLVERLLQLARATGGKEIFEPSLVRLDRITAECVEDLSILAEERAQKVVVETVPCPALTDPLLYRQVLQNLLDNALKFSPEGALIRVSLRVEGKDRVVAVEDDGPGIDPRVSDFVMDRFFRVDESRGRETGGFGLGLAITKAYAKVLGGTITYEPIRPHGSRFKFTLPG